MTRLGSYDRSVLHSVLAVWMAVLLVVAAACGGGSDDGAESETPAPAGAVDAGFGILQPADLAEMLARKDFLFVNVHIPYEGEIDRTDLFMPYNEVEQHATELPADKAAKIVLYCQSGRMSEIAARTLLEMGYTDVSHLDGGMVAWRAAGHELLDKRP